MTEQNQREEGLGGQEQRYRALGAPHMKSDVNKYDRDSLDFNPIGWALLSCER